LGFLKGHNSESGMEERLLRGRRFFLPGGDSGFRLDPANQCPLFSRPEYPKAPETSGKIEYYQ